MAGRFDIDITNPELADALADAGAAASGIEALSADSAIGHVGSPEGVRLDLTGIDVDAIIEACTDHAASWKRRIPTAAWDDHRTIVDLPEISEAAVGLASGLRNATAVGSVMVFDNTIPGSMPWQWPLKIGWIRGTIGEALADCFAGGAGAYWMHTLTEFVEYGSDTMPGLIDLLIVPEHADPHPLLASRGVRANALVLADESTPAIERLDQAREIAEHLGAGALLVPRVDSVDELVDWLTRLVEEVSHKLPLDVAMGRATTAGVVIGNQAAMTAPLHAVVSRMAARAHEVIGTPPRTVEPPRFGIGGDEPDGGRGLVAPPPLPGDLELLQLPDDEAFFSAESDGATRVREFREANELGSVDLLPDASAERLLRAALFRDFEPVEQAFAGGAEHELHLWIGNGATGFLSAETPSGAPALIDHDDLSPDVPADLAIWGEGVDIQVQSVLVSKRLLSELASFTFSVPARAKEFALKVALLVDGRVVQSGVISGPVTPSGGKPRRENAPIMRFVVGPNLVDLSVLDGRFGSDTVTIMEDPSGIHTMFKSAVGASAIESLQQHFDRSLALLVEAQVDAKQSSWLASAEGAKTFSKLARQGADAFQSLVDAWALDEPDRLAAMISTDAVHVATFDIDETQLAVELFYDREAPTPDAGWCDGFDAALQSGVCPTCVPWDPSARTPDSIPVCPAGFWGIRKIIERTTVPTDSQGFPLVLQNRTRSEEDPIDSLDRVLIGTSNRVDKATIENRKPTAVMLDRINECIGTRPPVVEDWDRWQEEVEAKRPQVLVLLTHTTNDSLELGADAHLDRLRIKSFFVRQPFEKSPAGPIVLLLGCDTASTDSSLTSFASKFMQRGASVVVATIGSTLGRFAAPIAGELVAAIADPNGAPTIGEALRDVRRDTLKKGWVTGLLVNAYGAADYTFNRTGF